MKGDWMGVKKIICLNRKDAKAVNRSKIDETKVQHQSNKSSPMDANLLSCSSWFLVLFLRN